jgi:hypothetical protein
MIATFALAMAVGSGGAATTSQAARPAACQELIVNGGFEDGSAGWTQYSKLGNPLIDSFYPFTGKLGAWLAGQDNAEDRLTQTLTLPGGGMRLTLRYWWSIDTEEPPGGAFDTGRTELLRPDNSVIATMLVIDHDSAEPGVWNEAVADLTAHAGQNVQLRFRAVTDAINPTSFYYDDVSLLVCPDEATPTPTRTATATATVAATATPRARLYLPMLMR